MGFDISGATIGVDEKGMKEVLNDIKANLIDDAQDEIKEGLGTLKTNLSNFWKGEAANEFKDSLDAEYKKLKDYLENLKDKLERDLGTMAANVGQADQDAADAIKAAYK